MLDVLFRMRKFGELCHIARDLACNRLYRGPIRGDVSRHEILWSSMCSHLLQQRVGFMTWTLRFAATAILAAACATPAASQSATCATRATSATGATALLEGAARGKARVAWMRRVTASKRLGPSYATWLRAKSPTYACKRAGKSYVCVATAVPCKV